MRVRALCIAMLDIRWRTSFRSNPIRWLHAEREVYRSLDQQSSRFYRAAGTPKLRASRRFFFAAMARMHERGRRLRFVMPAASPAIRGALQRLAGRYPQLPLSLIDGHSHRALEACDAALVASGTATLEAALYKKPMVISYQVP